MERLELVLAFLLLSGKMSLACTLGKAVEALQNKDEHEFIVWAKRAGLSQKDMRELIWEARSTNALSVS